MADIIPFPRKVYTAPVPQLDRVPATALKARAKPRQDKLTVRLRDMSWHLGLTKIIAAEGIPELYVVQRLLCERLTALWPMQDVDVERAIACKYDDGCLRVTITGPHALKVKSAAYQKYQARHRFVDKLIDDAIKARKVAIRKARKAASAA